MNYSVNWFSPKNFDKYLSHLINNKNNFLEIGSFEGLSTNYFIDTFFKNKETKIICIDPWIKYSEATVTKMVGFDDKINENTYNVFLKNTSHNKNNIVIKKGFSKDIIPNLIDNYFDFIFIDGDHSEDAVWIDATSSFPKLKNNGIMIFDDYDWGPPSKRNPKLAIDKFLKEYKNKINILGFPPHTGNQVVIQKKDL